MLNGNGLSSTGASHHNPVHTSPGGRGLIVAPLIMGDETQGWWMDEVLSFLFCFVFQRGIRIRWI